MIKKIVNWILIILAAAAIVALAIFGSAVYYTIIFIARGLGLIIMIGLVVWLIVKINKLKLPWKQEDKENK